MLRALRSNAGLSEEMTEHDTSSSVCTKIIFVPLHFSSFYTFAFLNVLTIQWELYILYRYLFFSQLQFKQCPTHVQRWQWWQVMLSFHHHHVVNHFHLRFIFLQLVCSSLPLFFCLPQVIFPSSLWWMLCWEVSPLFQMSFWTIFYLTTMIWLTNFIVDFIFEAVLLKFLPLFLISIVSVSNFSYVKLDSSCDILEGLSFFSNELFSTKLIQNLFHLKYWS